jgi:hypothetical protein
MERDLYVQMVKAILKTRGSKVRLLQFIQFLDYVQDTCPWFPEKSTVNLDTWQKVGEKLRSHYTVEGQTTCQSLLSVCGVRSMTA